MDFVPLHYKVSRPVTDHKAIETVAKEMAALCAKPRGNYEQGFSIAHTQVEAEDPQRFFVVHDQLIKDKIFKHQVIMNPEILEVDEDSRTLLKEACMSVPHRDPKKIRRYTRIKVRYQVPGLFGLKWVKEDVSEIKAQMFQHEIDHMDGKNIYWDAPARAVTGEGFHNSRHKSHDRSGSN